MARRPRAWCARPGCRHAPSRHMLDAAASCSCGCPGWEERWPHWWRDLVVSTWFGADTFWLSERERIAIGYNIEMAEYAEQYPRPTFKRVLIGLAGMTGGVAWHHADP